MENQLWITTLVVIETNGIDVSVKPKLTYGRMKDSDLLPYVTGYIQGVYQDMSMALDPVVSEHEENGRIHYVFKVYSTDESVDFSELVVMISMEPIEVDQSDSDSSALAKSLNSPSDESEGDDQLTMKGFGDDSFNKDDIMRFDIKPLNQL